MDKEKALAQLDSFKERLRSDVCVAYGQRGSDFGRERFAAWRRQISKFLDENLPGAKARLDQKLQRSVFYRGNSETDYDVFVREDGEPSLAFIDSLRLDIQNNEYDFSPAPAVSRQTSRAKAKPSSAATANEIFIVHGHDDALKVKAARFVEKLGYKAIILQEQASRGKTIIETIEAYANVGFAIVLYTADDLGAARADAEDGALNPRPRQNVVFEHGYLIARLSRANVVPLVAGKIELPSDISGVVYIEDTNWRIEIAKEMKAAGYNVDFNRLVDS